MRSEGFHCLDLPWGKPPTCADPAPGSSFGACDRHREPNGTGSKITRSRRVGTEEVPEPRRTPVPSSGHTHRSSEITPATDPDVKDLTCRTGGVGPATGDVSRPGRR